MNLEFINKPQNLSKLRSDSLNHFKGEDNKPVSIKINNYEAHRCKLVISLFMKEQKENTPHFHRLYKVVDKNPTMEIEHELNQKESIIKLDFLGIKKALKKEALKYLKDVFKKNVEDLYKKHASTIILQISLINMDTNRTVHILKHELSDRNDNIIVKAYSPHVLLYNEEMITTFVLENSEKDSESISLELDIQNIKSIRPKELDKPTSLKNVFLFSLKHIELTTKNFKARLCRKASKVLYSSWMNFRLLDSGIERGKRKSNDNEINSPAPKILRPVTMAISEISITEFCYDDYLSSPASSLSIFNQESNNKSSLKSIFETRVLTSIARVGHDFAFGRPITDLMENISIKLPLVYILQDDVGDTPLHNAILKDHEERAIKIIDILEKKFPDQLQTKNTSNHTALILAPACNMSRNFVRRLILLGFRLDDKDIEGNSALDIAIEYKNSQILETLVQYASIQKVFDNNRWEVLSLVKKTIEKQYFDGYQIFMQSQLADDLLLNFLDSTDLELDSESEAVFRLFSKQINLVDTALPELTIENNLDFNNLDSDTVDDIDLNYFINYDLSDT